MLQLPKSRSLSLWSNYNLCCLCCVIVLTLNTCPLVYSGNNSTVSQCQCNSTITGSNSLNTTENHCNCTQGTNNCETGYHFVNGTCVQCACNSTKTQTNCNCPSVQNKLTCLPGQFLAISSHKCENCSCNLHTSLNNNCNNRTGQCYCREHVTGQQCTVCATNFTASSSNSGKLLNCLEPCPKGFKRAARNECIKENTTSSLSSTKVLSSSLMVMSSTHGIPMPTNIMVLARITSTTVLTTLSTGIPSSLPSTQKTSSSTYLVPIINSSILTIPSPSITRPLSTKKSPTMQIPSSTVKSPPPSSSPPPPPLSPPSSSSPSSSSPSSSSPSSSSPPSSSPPSTTNPPLVTTNKLTTDHVPTTSQEHTTKPNTETDKPSSEKPTTKVHHTNMPSNDRSSDVVVIVLTCLGVVAILGIAIAVGCWCLRSKRKPSTPFWTVELSNTRNNEELDFALLDPVTDEPYKKPNDTSEADASITEHSRYYAYI